MLRLAITAAVLVIAARSSAGEWWITGGGETTLAFVDVSNLKRVGSIAEVWQDHYNQDRSSLKISHDILRTRWDCDKRLYKNLSFIYYNELNDVIRTKEYTNAERQWTSIAPDTLGDAELRLICASPSTRDLFATKNPSSNQKASGLYFELMKLDLSTDPPVIDIVASALNPDVLLSKKKLDILIPEVLRSDMLRIIRKY